MHTIFAGVSRRDPLIIKDGYLRGSLPRTPTARQVDVFAAFVADRRALATTLFERIRVLGVSVAKLEPTQEALDHGLAEAFGPDELEMVGTRGLKPPALTSMSRSGSSSVALK